jgi:hypothetical protein
MYILFVSQDRYLDLLNIVLYSCRLDVLGSIVTCVISDAIIGSSEYT